MTGWTIFTYSVRQLTENLPEALRISVGPYLINAVAQAYFMKNYGALVLSHGAQINAADVPPGFVGAVLMMLAAVAVSSIWIAVAWHRFILLREEPGALLPAFRGNAIVGYLGWSIVLGLIAGVAAMVFGLVAGLILAFLPAGAGLFSMLLIGIPTMLIVYRLGLKLPAAAIDEDLPFSEAWARTAGANGVIFQVAVLILGLSLLLSLPGMSNADPGSTINILYTLVTDWIVTLVGVSVLTTLYEVYIGGRRLA